MAGKDVFKNMQLANVRPHFDNLLGSSKFRFGGKRWDQGKARFGIHPEYFEKKWLKIAIEEKKVVTIDPMSWGYKCSSSKNNSLF